MLVPAAEIKRDTCTYTLTFFLLAHPPSGKLIGFCHVLLLYLIFQRSRDFPLAFFYYFRSIEMTANEFEFDTICHTHTYVIRLSVERKMKGMTGK